MEMSKPQQEHQWLKRLVGEWEYEAESAMGPGQPTQKFKGAESVRSLGDLWYVAEAEGEMPGGGTAKMVMTLGYDPKKGRYVGTWIGSMMANLVVYDGAVDPAGKALALDAEMPSMSDQSKLATYRDVVEFQSDDQRTLTSLMQTEDGDWFKFMTVTYQRKK